MRCKLQTPSARWNSWHGICQPSGAGRAWKAGTPSEQDGYIYPLFLLLLYFFYSSVDSKERERETAKDEELPGGGTVEGCPADFN